MKKVSNQAQAVNIHFTSNWCYEQTIQLRPMKFWHKKRQAYYYKRKMIPGHEDEASRNKSLILFCTGQCSPCMPDGFCVLSFSSYSRNFFLCLLMNRSVLMVCSWRVYMCHLPKRIELNCTGHLPKRIELNCMGHLPKRIELNCINYSISIIPKCYFLDKIEEGVSNTENNLIQD